MEAFRVRGADGGKSTVQDMVLPFPAEGSRPGMNVTIPTTAFWLTRTARGAEVTGCAPHRHLVVVLSGKLHVTGADGSSRTAGPGDMILEDDLDGPGHTEVSEGEVWKLLLSTPGWDPPVGTSTVPPVEPRERWGRPLMSRMYDDGGFSRTDPFVWSAPLAPVPDVAQWPSSEGAWLSRSVYGPEEAHEFTWHQGPRRQIAVTLAGGGENETGDGTKTQPHGGDFVLVEDTTGQGHISRGRGDRRLLFVTVVDGHLTQRLSETP